MQLWLLVAVVAVAAVGSLGLSVVLLRRRRNAFQQIASGLGFRFSPQAQPFEGTNVQGLEILEEDSHTLVDNLLERGDDSCRFLICDVPQVGEASRTVTTVAAFRVRNLHLPVVQISEKSLVERAIEYLEHVVRKKTDSVISDAEFERCFRVHYADRGEAQAFLTPEKVGYLREHAEHFRIECSPDWLLVFRPGVKANRKNLKNFVEISSAIAASLLSIQKSQFSIVA
jgi:hypothetical protein